jgi:hypothetical protein
MMVRSGPIAAVLLALAAYSGPALSAGGEASEPVSGDTSTLDLTWNLYVGGVPMGTAAMTARIEGDTYRASSRLETQGIVNRFWQSKIETAAHGKIGVGRLRPLTYDSFQARDSGRRQEVTLSFDESGPIGIVANPPYNPERAPPVTEADLKHSLDPLSSVLFLTTSAEANDEKPCGVTAPVYDGRRRYDVAFSFVRKANVRMDNGLYAGPALICEVEYRQVAGYRQRIVERGMQMPKIYAWVATVPSTASPGRRYMIPVRFWADTEFGLITAVSSQVRIDGVDLRARG